MNATKWVTPAIAAGLLAFSVIHMVRAGEPQTQVQPVHTAPGDGERQVAGTGTIEPAGETVSVGVHRPGVVARIAVKTGDRVLKGTTLFCTDDRAARSEVRVREAELQLARSELGRLEQLPRSSAIAPLKAQLAVAEARSRRAADTGERTQALVKLQVEPSEQGIIAETGSLEAQHERQLVEANLRLAEEGAWKPDLRIAAAHVLRAEALLERAKIELALLCVQAPLDAVVLRVDLREGESVEGSGNSGHILLGSDSAPQVRAEFDEADISRWTMGREATAHFRGMPQVRAKLKLDRIEPLVAPKRAFSGASTERVDTRVLQAVYTFEGEAPKGAYVGQQVDVFVATQGPTG